MAKIPTAADLPRVSAQSTVGRIPRISVVPSAGAELAAIGEGLTELANRAAEADREIKVASAITEAKKRLVDEEINLARDPNFETHRDVFNKSANQTFAELSQDMDPKAKREFELNFNSFALQSETRVRRNALKMQVDNSTAILDKTLNDLAQELANADPGEEPNIRARAEAAVAKAEGGLIISRKAGEAKRAAFKAAVFQKKRGDALDTIATAVNESPESVRELTQQFGGLLEGGEAAKFIKQAETNLTERPKIIRRRVLAELAMKAPDTFAAVTGVPGVEQMTYAEIREQRATMEQQGAGDDALGVLDALSDLALNRDGGPKAELDTAVYNSIAEDIHRLKIISTKSDGETETTVAGFAEPQDVLRLQTKIISSVNTGKISRADGEKFLGPVMRALREVVSSESGTNAATSFVGGLFGAIDDPYDSAYEDILDLVDNAVDNDVIESRDADSLKTSLFRSFVDRADRTNLDTLTNEKDRLLAVTALTDKLKADFAAFVAPELKNIPPSELPNLIFKSDRRIVNVFGGAPRAKGKKTQGALFQVVRDPKTGEVFRLLKGSRFIVDKLREGK